ncbi:ATP-dependent DNA ligase [Microbacterium telephonicum]|uniref:DUF7882 domain-containing protein n=1 Tax=Microbacterium telephonicum TaxID=1714841 RepID=A0A498C7P6_9MICO|nr:ATP-dependent DNA ligase [Microbacterium telephonicum]RLK49050.1 hypothetical protein C7474_1182 [Microbacterium telephonicum]
MGRLVYEQSVRLEIDDRTLAHLQVVIAEKLRRGESFYFSWSQPPHEGSGRSVMWLHPDASLQFSYRRRRSGALSLAWIELLSEEANSPAGLQLVEEPEAGVDADAGTADL